MNTLRTFGLTASLAVQLLVAAAPYAQEAMPRYDLAFESRINEIPADLRQLDALEAENYQRAFAQEAFDYYLQHTETVTGAHAVEAAFRLWDNTAAVEKIDHALPLIGVDAPVWRAILRHVWNAYAKAGRAADFFELLVGLEQELTHPTARSEVLVNLGEQLLARQRDEEALARFNEVVALDDNVSIVGRAKGFIYEIETLEIGQLAPDFIAATLQGDSLKLSDLRGEVVVLEFWATWCGPCIPEIPGFKKLHEEYWRDGLRVIGVSLDSDLADLHALVREESISWVQIPQVEGIQSSLSRLFHVTHLPRSFLLDRQGRIVAKDVRGDKLVSAVAELMGDSKD